MVNYEYKTNRAGNCVIFYCSECGKMAFGINDVTEANSVDDTYGNGTTIMCPECNQR